MGIFKRQKQTTSGSDNIMSYEEWLVAEGRVSATTATQTTEKTEKTENDNSEQTLNKVLQCLQSFEKRQCKRDAKKLVRRKYKVGQKIQLRNKSTFDDEEYIKAFVIKGKVYTYLDNILNVYILKQIDGKPLTANTLSKHECNLLHVKFEQNLIILPMDFNWSIYKGEK